MSALFRLPKASPRTTELGLLVLGACIITGAYALAGLGSNASIPANIWPFLGVVLGLALLAHIAVRLFAKRAEATLLPIATLLNGLGYVVIARLSPKLAGLQAMWIAFAILAFILCIMLIRRVRDLSRYRYSLAIIGISLLVSPIIFGSAVNGSKIWIKIGPASFQPGEIAKIILAVFFAAYLVEKRELLSMSTRQIGGLLIPDLKHFGPILIAWAVAMAVLVFENDFGSSLLFFALFVTVLYVGTGRLVYIIISAVMLSIGGLGAYLTSGHVRDRVHVWTNPWQYFNTTGYQLIQAQYSMGAGGIHGTGLGLGSPTTIPAAETDFIFAAIGEELGVIGTIAILACFLLFVGIGLRIALRATNPFEKLLTTGLTAIIAIQTFVIVGGILRVVPLTGVTLPFVSYGGSSLVTNYILLALLLRLSHDQIVHAEELGWSAEDPERVS